MSNKQQQDHHHKQQRLLNQYQKQKSQIQKQIKETSQKKQLFKNQEQNFVIYINDKQEYFKKLIKNFMKTSIELGKIQIMTESQYCNELYHLWNKSQGNYSHFLELEENKYIWWEEKRIKKQNLLLLCQLMSKEHQYSKYISFHENWLMSLKSEWFRIYEQMNQNKKQQKQQQRNNKYKRSQNKLSTIKSCGEEEDIDQYQQELEKSFQKKVYGSNNKHQKQQISIPNLNMDSSMSTEGVQDVEDLSNNHLNHKQNNSIDLKNENYDFHQYIESLVEIDQFDSERDFEENVEIQKPKQFL